MNKYAYTNLRKKTVGQRFNKFVNNLFSFNYEELVLAIVTIWLVASAMAMVGR